MKEAVIERRPTVTSQPKRFAFPSQTAFLSQAALLQEAGPPRLPAMACLLGFILVCVGILAGMLIQIDVVTSSQGHIVAANGNRVLQSFDGGIVDKVHVEEGQIVEKDELLLKLDDPEAHTQLKRLMVREAGLSAQARRLQTLAELPAIPSAEQTPEAQVAANDQMSILPIEQQAMIAERALIQAENSRRSKVIGNLRSLMQKAVTRASLIQERLQAERKLHAKGLSPKSSLLEIEQEFTNAAYDIAEIQGQIREAQASLLESERRLDDVMASRRLRQGDQLSSILIDLGETRQQVKAMRERLQRAHIRASGRGIILELKVRHHGQTVAPGDPVVEIVPIDGVLMAETRLPPSEISHVKSGQSARIAVDGIEPHRHGYLNGKVESISPSTFVGDDSLPYYRTSIALSSESLDGMPLTPGMTIQAQIKTGQRTIAEYLLKPVYRAWDTAFRER